MDDRYFANYLLLLQILIISGSTHIASPIPKRGNFSLNIIPNFSMRLKKEQIRFLKDTISRIIPDADIFLFGSRRDDKLKGGDIDILVIGHQKLSLQEIRDIRIAFGKRFGFQKIDIVSYKNDESSTFKELAMLEAVRL